MNKIKHNSAINKRKNRVRGKIHGTSLRPRVSIYRSQKNIYVQAIDDEKGVTLVASNDLHLAKSNKKELKGTKIEKAGLVAKNLADKLKAKKISSLAFDRGHYKYHGRVRKVAEVLREAGMEV